MNWQKIKCSVVGHRYRAADWHKQAACIKCGKLSAAMPYPARPAPTMPECKPPADWRDRAEVIELLDQVERLTARVERLEVAQAKQSKRDRLLMKVETTYGSRPSWEITPLTEAQAKPIIGKTMMVTVDGRNINPMPDINRPPAPPSPPPARRIREDQPGPERA